MGLLGGGRSSVWTDEDEDGPGGVGPRGVGPGQGYRDGPDGTIAQGLAHVYASTGKGTGMVGTVEQRQQNTGSRQMAANTNLMDLRTSQGGSLRNSFTIGGMLC